MTSVVKSNSRSPDDESGENKVGINEHEFINGLRNGDPGCYETLVRQYGGQMLAVARRYLKDEVEAQDCVQDAYLQAFRNIYKFQQRSSLKSWLHRIVVNSALMKIRSRKRHPEEFIEDNPSKFDSNGFRMGNESGITLSVEMLAVKKETREMIRRCIDQLPEHARILLLLRDIEGYTTSETATLLGISNGAVKTGLHRARGKLKLLLESIINVEDL